MIITSFNVKGLCSGPKRTTLKILIDIYSSDIVLLQETMISAHSACDFLLRIKPGWMVIAIDVVGLFGGTLVAWNPLVANLKSFSTCAGVIH